MIDDVSAINVQAVAFAAAEILHKEESSVSSRAGRIAEGCVRRSVHEVYSAAAAADADACAIAVLAARLSA